MLKSFDIRVQSRYSGNYYNAFRVDTARNTVYFHQCDSRRGGQVARYMQITVMPNGMTKVEARSANGSRYEQFKRTQCLSLALRLLQEAKDELRQIESVQCARSKPMSDCLVLGILFGMLALMVVYFGLTQDPEEYLTTVRVVMGAICGLLSVGSFYEAYLESTAE